MDPSISLLEIHKLMYFLQAAGQPLKLRYVKAPYGARTPRIFGTVLHAIDGHLVAGYTGEGDAATGGAGQDSCPARLPHRGHVWG